MLQNLAARWGRPDRVICEFSLCADVQLIDFTDISGF